MCLLTGGRLDLSRGAKHLPGRLVEHAHKKSQVWQTWSRLPSKVVSSFLLRLIHRQSPYYLLLPTCRVSPSLVKRRKTHFHQLPIGASIILGNNGLVWLHPSREEEGGGGIENKSQKLTDPSSSLIIFIGGGGWAADLGVVSLQEREVYKPFFNLDGIIIGLDILTDLESIC